MEITNPSQIAVVGDRLFTDVMMANMMGSYGIWVKDGVVPNTSIVSFRDTNLREIGVDRNSSQI